jgi:hypothetical protein
VERKHLDDRQLDALLERLDRVTHELHVLNTRLETADGLARIAYELRTLTDAMQTLAYAALGKQGPNVQRRPGPG